MQRKLFFMINRHLRNSTHRRMWARVVQFMACIVVFCTTYALILPAITIEKQCQLEEHSHTTACYAQLTSVQAQSLICDTAPHCHGENCYAEEELICGQADFLIHSHNEFCYDGENLICPLSEISLHSHSSQCYEEGSDQSVCGQEEVVLHRHWEDCYAVIDGVMTLVCAQPEVLEHVHTEDCVVTETIQLDVTELTCTLSEESHTHGEQCYGQWELTCTLQEHTHDRNCSPGLELTEAEQEAVARVSGLIQVMPSGEEIEAELIRLRESGDEAAEEAYLTEIYDLVGDIYQEYMQLHENIREYVENREKLLELEYIWSAETLVSNVPTIKSAAPTVGNYTSTSDFIELNLYDYNFNINNWWRNNHKYPGFQWNGGAYSKDGTNYRTDNAGADAGVPNYFMNRHRADSIDFGNSLITNVQYHAGEEEYGKSVNATSVTGKGGLINGIDNSSYGITNRPIGMSTGEEVLWKTLINGYPALVDQTSLSYLFGDESADVHNAVTKMNTASIDGLFLQNSVTGEYSYNSRQNHAQYSNNFFTRYNQFLTPNFIIYPFGNFMPFNTISDSTQATQVLAFNYAGGMKAYVDAIRADLTASINANPTDWKTTTRQQLRTMLEEYAESWKYDVYNGAAWSAISPANAIRDYFQMPGDGPSDNVGFVSEAHLGKMYNIDWDVDKNFFFGMEMKMEFIQPRNGYTGHDTNGDGQSDYPMVFEFSGDDDVWVYIDDVLFLDLSGIHRHVGGKIDFVNGIVSYYPLDTAGTGDVSTTPYITYSFAYLFRQAGWTEAQIDAVLKPIENYNRPFKDYTKHKFNFYYVERGSGSSVCRINFNFPLLKKNTISVVKELTSTTGVEMVGNPDFSFQIMKADGSTFYGAGVPYNIYDADTNKLIGTGTTEAYGTFKIKAGQRAEFSGITEDSGKYYVREILHPTFVKQYGNIYVDGTAVTTRESVYNPADKITYVGVRSPVKDISEGSTMFTFNNHVDAEKLSFLTITKLLENVNASLAQTLSFDMKVEMNGVLGSPEGWVPIPVGTPYTLYQTDLFINKGQKVEISNNPHRVVTTEGIVTVPYGATAEIDNLIPGTTFRVSETEGSAFGYTVTYKGFWGTDWIKVYDDRVEGTIPVYNPSNTTDRTDSHSCVTVTNKLNATPVTFQVQKQIPNANQDTAAHTVSFTATCIQALDGSKYTSPGSDSSKDGFEKGGASVLERIGNNAVIKQSVAIDDTQSQNAIFNLYFNASMFSDYKLPIKLVYEIREDVSPDLEYSHDPAVYYAVFYLYNAGSNKLGLYQNRVYMTSGAPYPGGTAIDAGNPAAFTNYLLGDLSLEKIVDGGTTLQQEHAFDFTIQFGVNSTTPLQNVTLTMIKNGEAAGTVNTGTDGIVKLTDVKHGDKILLKGIPLGVVWRITETNAETYDVSWTKNGESGTSNVATGNIPAGGMEVVFTNRAAYAYELPETGGAGTTSYTMAGLVLILFSMAFLLYKSIPCRREAFQSP